jgi:hypothetical protein
MDYSASVSDRVPNIDHVALTLSLPVSCLANPVIAVLLSIGPLAR